MEIGFLHGTFRFKLLTFSIFFLLTILLTFFSKPAHAAWFSIYNGGILSGRNASGAYDILPQIPGGYSLPTGFSLDAIQGGTSPRASRGAIITRQGFTVQVAGGAQTLDAYVKRTGVGSAKFGTFNFNTFINSGIAFTNISGSGCSASTFTSGTLSPTTVYRTNVTCMESIINGLAGNAYNISSNGVVYVVVEVGSTGDSVLNIDYQLRAGNIRRRLFFITDAKVEIGSNVGLLQSALASRVADFYNGSVISYIQAGFLTTNASGFEVVSAGVALDRAILLDGPIISRWPITLNRELNDVNVAGTIYRFPGVYIKYNTLYVSDLIGKSSLMPELFKQKTTWRYE